MTRIFVGADHAGFGLKEKLIPYLLELGYEVKDCGAYEYNEEDDFPDFIIPVAREVSQHSNDTKGIILGGSGQGEAMAANKFNNVRAAVFYGERHYLASETEEENESIISITRADNDSNVLALGARFITEEEMREAVREWLETPFKNSDKYVRRNNKMSHINESR